MQHIQLCLGATACILATACAPAASEFTLTVPGPGRGVGNSLLELPDGGYLVVGYNGDRGTDAHAVRVTRSGEIVWSRTYGTDGFDAAWEAVALPGGRFAIAGFSAPGPTTSETDAWVFTIDASGELIQERYYPREGADRLTGVVATEDGGLVVVGQNTRSIGGTEDAVAMRVDSMLEPVWTRALSAPGRQRLFAVASRPAGPVLAGLVDDIHNLADSASADRDIWVIAYDWNGSVRWEHRERIPGHQTAHNIMPWSDGVLVTAYGEDDFGGDNDLILIAIDDSGTVSWQRRIGGPDDERAMMTTRSGDRLLTVGYRNVDGRDWDMWLVETDSEGALVAETVIPHPGRDWAVTARATHGGIVLTGMRDGGSTAGDLVLMRLPAARLATPP